VNSPRPPGLPQSDTVYRDAALGARTAIRHLTSQHRRELAAVAPEAGDVYAARVGRIVGGVALLAGALTIIALLVARAASSAHIYDGATTLVLLASWPVALVFRSAGRLAGRRRFAVVSNRALAMPDDAYPDLVSMRRLDVAASVRRLLERLEAPSVGIPLAGMVLLAPLTLHLLLMVPSGLSVAGFEHWIVLSAVLVGHCHVVLAAMALRYGHVLARGTDTAAARRAGWHAYRLTVGTSFFPGVFLIGIPVFLVGLTGLFAPGMFAAMRCIVDNERKRTSCSPATGDS
jgi:hypothetical protein